MESKEQSKSNSKALTVGELKEFLTYIPDSTEIFILNNNNNNNIDGST